MNKIRPYAEKLKVIDIGFFQDFSSSFDIRTSYEKPNKDIAIHSFPEM